MLPVSCSYRMYRVEHKNQDITKIRHKNPISTARTSWGCESYTKNRCIKIFDVAFIPHSGTREKSVVFVDKKFITYKIKMSNYEKFYKLFQTKTSNFNHYVILYITSGFLWDMYSGRSTLSTFSTLNSNNEKNRCIYRSFFNQDAVKG